MLKIKQQHIAKRNKTIRFADKLITSTEKPDGLEAKDNRQKTL